MMQALIVDNNLMAFGPFTSDEHNIVGSDLIFQKNMSLNWKVIEADIPIESVVPDWEFNGTTVVKRGLTKVPAPVPEVVSPRQIRQALTRVDLRAAVESAIAASDQDMKDWYEFATAFERTNSHVIAMGVALNVSDGQLDDLWRLAGSL